MVNAMWLIAVRLIAMTTIATGTFGNTLPGGYATAEIGKDIVVAAEFAVKQESLSATEPLTLRRILQAEQQIVAGVNYRLVLIVRKAGVEQKARAIVFRDLNSQFFLKSWEWLDSH